jgi:hypothetical protein
MKQPAGIILNPLFGVRAEDALIAAVKSLADSMALQSKLEHTSVTNAKNSFG